MSLTAGTALNDAVDLHDPEDICDAILNRQPLAIRGDDAPWEMLKALRDQAPIFPSQTQGMTFVTRYRDALATLRHPTMDLGFKMRADAEAGQIAATLMAPTMLYFRDPADTMRQRKLMRPAFTRQAVLRRAEDIAGIVDPLLDECAERGTFDFFADFVDNVPVAVMCQTLGVPREDVPIFRDWTRAGGPATGARMSDEVLREVHAAYVGLRDYMTDLVGRRRRNPLDDDLLSVMIKAADDGTELSDEELIGLAIFALAAGSDTTTQLLTSAAYTLARFPEQQAALRADRAIMPDALEELIRHSGPVQYAQPRLVCEKPLELDGATVAVGDVVFTSVGGANRDPDQFAHPDELDFERRDIRHLGFSQGMHLCIGAMLARMESTIVLEKFLDKFASYEVLEEEVEYLDFATMRAIAGLRIATVAA
jgi:pimeloyl-[acyl-carrier protein] synthase